MTAGGEGGGSAVDHNGMFSNASLHSPQHPHMDTENADSRKRPLDAPAEEAGCTKRTNTGGRSPEEATRAPLLSLKSGDPLSLGFSACDSLNVHAERVRVL